MTFTVNGAANGLLPDLGCVSSPKEGALVSAPGPKARGDLSSVSSTLRHDFGHHPVLWRGCTEGKSWQPSPWPAEPRAELQDPGPCPHPRLTSGSGSPSQLA